LKKYLLVLLLEDGKEYHGYSAGKIGTSQGEICFNTGMTGYQEVFTDPSYFGQLLVTTNAHIGNYGTQRNDIESNGIQISGLICKNFTNLYSRKQADYSIQEYFIENQLIGISDVDTRAIVRYIRDKGAMNAIISSEDLNIDSLKSKLAQVPSMNGLELATQVSTKKPYDFGSESAKYKIAVLDLGVKKNILNCLQAVDCKMKIFPATTSFAEMQKWQPDAYFFSNGPGDPAPLDFAIKAAKNILDVGIPFFGICLGHQVLARALGLDTFKMHHGHRGANHPVINLENGRCEITTQNHGFAVSAESHKNLSDLIILTHENLNDRTVEGFRVKNKKAFSVQFHPEASPGPHDSSYLFEQFIQYLTQS